MKIFYVTDAALPSKYTNSIHITKQCQGFADNQCKTVLICKKQETFNQQEDIYIYYNVKRNFSLKRLTQPFFLFGRLIFHIKILLYLKKHKGIIYTREIRIAAYAIVLRRKIVLELHHPVNPDGIKRSLFWKYIYERILKSKRLIKLVVISEKLKNELEKSTDNLKILVAPDAADLPGTNTRLNLNAGELYNAEIGYLGHLYEGKGMELIFEIAKCLPNTRFHIVGGTDKDLEYWTIKMQNASMNNILFHGYVKPNSISKYLNSFDICLLPNQKAVILSSLKIDIGQFTSPLKMFDYMAHSKPIIASNLPVLREVLNETNAILCDPENVQEWVNAITMLSNNPELREKLGKKAFEDFKENYTWKIRAERILNSLHSDPT